MQSGSSLRVHRRSIYLHGASWTILSARESESARVATGTADTSVHLLTSVAGLAFLARFVWAVAFQTHDRTAMLLDLPMLMPNPMTGEFSRPVVFANSETTIPSEAMLDELRRHLPLVTPSEGTVRLRTAGFDRAQADHETFEAGARADAEASPWDTSQWDEWVKREAGLVTVVMPPAALRTYAVAAAEIARSSHESTRAQAPGNHAIAFDSAIVARARRIQGRSRGPHGSLSE